MVDLAIARGGDLGLLESLTSIEAESPHQPRALMAEQITTLRYAMTQPNVQLIVYEVHTVLPSETTEMIEEAVSYANKMATDKYQREHPVVSSEISRRSLLDLWFFLFTAAEKENWWHWKEEDEANSVAGAHHQR